MKISESGLGKKAMQVAREVESLKSGETSGAGQAAALATPDAPGMGLTGKVAELKSTLDQVRNLLGQRAVDLLVQDLPKAAVDALQAAKGDLPVEAGKSPYLTFKAKNRQLMQLEVEAQSNLQKLRNTQVIGEYGVAKTLRSLNSSGVNLKVTQGLADRDALKALNPNADLATVYKWEESAKTASQRVNNALRLLDPDIAPEDLCKDPYGKGPGTRELADVLPSIFEANSIEHMRERMPGYASTLRDVATLRAHLAEAGVSSEDKVIALKSELFSDEIPVEALHAEAIKLIGEVAGIDGSGGMTNQSRLKREVMQDSHSTMVQTEGSGSSSTRNYDAHGRPDGSSYSHSQHASRTHASGTVTREILRPSAREYTVTVSPDASLASERLLQSLDKANTVDAVEVPILVDRLLTVRRMYEAMAVREPDSPYTSALRSWVEESDFQIGFVGKNHYNGLEPEQTVRLNMGNLRNDVVEHHDKLGLPASATALVKEELNLGPARKQGPLSSLSSLSSL